MTKRASKAAADEDLLRLAYQASIQLSSSNAEVIWGIFNAMLLANTIVVGAATLTLSAERITPIVPAILAILGLVTSAFWFFLVKRARSYTDYFILAAREMEETYFAPRISLLARGGQFAQGEPVELVVGGSKRTLRMDSWSRKGRVETASAIVIPAFFTVNLVLLVIALVQFGA